MTVRACLKEARAMLAEQYRRLAGSTMRPDFFLAIEVFADSGAELLEATDLIESIAVPANWALNEAVTKFMSTQVDADGLRAIELAKAEGAATGLWSWLNDPARTPEHVLRVLTAAILKAA